LPDDFVAARAVDPFLEAPREDARRVEVVFARDLATELFAVAAFFFGGVFDLLTGAAERANPKRASASQSKACIITKIPV
jgi:hypothetical protein